MGDEARYRFSWKWRSMRNVEGDERIRQGLRILGEYNGCHGFCLVSPPSHFNSRDGWGCTIHAALWYLRGSTFLLPVYQSLLLRAIVVDEMGGKLLSRVVAGLDVE